MTKWKMCLVGGHFLSDIPALFNAAFYADEVVIVDETPLRIGISHVGRETVRGNLPAILLAHAAGRGGFDAANDILEKIGFAHCRCVSSIRDPRLDSTVKRFVDEVANLEGRPPGYLAQVTKSLEDDASQWLDDYFGGDNVYIDGFIGDAQTVLVGKQFYRQRSVTRRPHDYAFSLMRAMSQVLLPDLGMIPPDELMELRQHPAIRGNIENLRSEMLRLAEHLEQVVREREAPDVHAEAIRLINYRVEPAVRATRAEIESRLTTKLRRFVSEGLSFIGLTSLAVIFPPVTPAAIARGVDLLTRFSFSADSDYRPSGTAKVLLFLDSAMNRRRNKGEKIYRKQIDLIRQAIDDLRVVEDGGQR